jgi:nicotinate-nucleotide adenylyltransferase
VRFGILGGSFDPPHIGHLLAANDASANLNLDQVVFVPAGTQPLKAGQAAASGAQRLAMVRAMVDGDPRFLVSSLEVDRPGLSFTVDTLRHFAKEYPAAERFLLLGADVLSTFSQWREPDEVVRLAQPVILVRNGAPTDATDVGALAASLRIPTRRVDVSSTEVRERVRQGRSIRGFVTDGVAAIIARDGLYRDAGGSGSC